MMLEVKLQEGIIQPPAHPACDGIGAVAEFYGVVRGEENGQPIAALVYEAYPGMAEREMRRVAEEEAKRHPVDHVEIIHRTGAIPVGETAIWVRVRSRHRAEAFGFLAGFMDRLKQDVPIWKVRSLPEEKKES
ncbi:MAG: molybdenum cofactor biosynthesis protein MoaE [Blastochloris sp.]|nr:molybdenum cofactor biosynthesis protein MoaE [Blastochloris sp.]